MDDCVSVVFFDVGFALGSKKNDVYVSPTAYIHWGGEYVEELLEKTKSLVTCDKLGGLRLNSAIAFARFVGIAHASIAEYSTDFGAWNTPSYVSFAIKRVLLGSRKPVKAKSFDYGKMEAVMVSMSPKEALEAYSPGGAGLIVVDCRDFSWKAYGGYLAKD